MTITAFTKPICKSLSDEVEAAVRVIAQRHGLTVRQAGGKFDQGKFNCHVEFALAVGTEGAEAAERKEFDAYCFSFNCRPEHYGVKITVRGEEWTLIGFAPRWRKFPVKLRDPKGKVMLFQESVLRHLSGWKSLEETFKESAV